MVIKGLSFPVFINEFWTAQQRQANALHEVSYRACFKPQLPRFFIDFFTKKDDIIYDPFNGRGTTVIEAGLMQRRVIANDVNPISLILTTPRLNIPHFDEVQNRIDNILFKKGVKANLDLSMFYHRDTEHEIVSLKNYLKRRLITKKQDHIDRWIRMVATNRLTGHSKGFFSVYTLPPNQALLPERQEKINRDRKQKPEYRDVKRLIIRKSKALLKNIGEQDIKNLQNTSAKFLNEDAAQTKAILSGTVSLTVTSPPFLNVVQYATDNWLRCWFNDINVNEVAEKITMSKTVDEWSEKMQKVFDELYRITKKGGVVAFEVGEVRNASVMLEEAVIPMGLNSGFTCIGVMINQQNFTKTANIWGVGNNKSGTNTNRIVVFRKK